MTNSPKVSVLIPTYNYAGFLDETIQSVLNQTYTDYELIIVDNNSTDNTDEVVQKYLVEPRIKYHKNPSNLGLVGNWNRCLELASGEYIKFLCADDKFHPKILEKYVTIMDQYSNVSLITCDKQGFGSSTHQTITPLTHMVDGRTANLHMLTGHYCWIGEPSSVMFRRQDLRVGKFISEYKQYVDWEMWVRLLTVGDCYIVPEILVYVRFHGASISKEQKRKRFVVCFEDYKLCKDVQQHRYNIDLVNSGIDNAVRESAMLCIKLALFRTIPELHKKESRQAFIKAFKIANNEKLLSASIFELFKGIKRKFIKQTPKIHHEPLT